MGDKNGLTLTIPNIKLHSLGKVMFLTTARLHCIFVGHSWYDIS